MALGFKIQVKNGVHYLLGVFDEAAGFRPLNGAPRPLKLNVAGITSVNSLGIRQYIRFITDLGDAELELHECPDVFVEMINTFPATLGTPSRPERVRSIWVPYQCRSCAKDFGLLLHAHEFAGCHSRFPARVCPRCAAALECQSDPTDSLLFVRHPD